MGQRIKPKSIRLEASSFCQLRCPSCPTTTRAIHPAVGSGYLDLDNFRTLLDGSPGVTSIELSNYGEIFLNPQLLPFLELAHARGVTLSAANGVNLNHVRDDVLEGLVKYGFDSMTCSIDGASPETYKIYRVKGDFDRVIGNIRKLNAFKKKYGADKPALHWQFVVFGHNEHEIAEARRLARELDMELHLKITWDDSFSPIRDKEKVRKELGVGAVTRDEYREAHGETYAQEICHQLWDWPQINWDGKVLGCCRNFWGEFGGNAFKDGLDAAVNSEGIAYAREMLLGRKPPRDGIPCTTCEMYTNMRDSGRYLRRWDPSLMGRVKNRLWKLGRVLTGWNAA
jgi:MoaA/NifB/PqqE/SkfB family radical SAM enzyme